MQNRKYYLFLILLPALAFAQFPKNNTWNGWKMYERTASAVVDTVTPLLDLYGGEAAAYSVRLLDSLNPSTYCVTIRRNSDDATQDIGYSGGCIDTAAIKSFCGADSGYVTKWYDQSGNNLHAEQSTAIMQPCIYAGGAIIYEGNIPAIKFGVNIFLTIKAIGQYAVNMNMAVLVSNKSGAAWVISAYDVMVNNVTHWQLQTKGDDNLSSGLNGYALLCVDYESNAFRGNGAELSTGDYYTATQRFYINSYNGTATYSNAGTIQEMVFWPTTTSITSQRSNIELNINSYYGIY